MPFKDGKYIAPTCYCGDTGEIESYDGQFASYCTACNLGKLKSMLSKTGQSLASEQYTHVVYPEPVVGGSDKDCGKGAGGVDQGIPGLLGTQVGGEHYKALSPQPIEVIEQWGLGFHTGAALKYIARAGRKAGNSAKQDIEKAVWFLQRYAETLN